MYSTHIRNRTERLSLVITAIAVAGTALTACEGHTEDMSHYQVGENVTSLSIRTNGGTVDLTTSNSSRIGVTEHFWYTGEKPRTEHPVRNGELVLNAPDCRATGADECGVDYTVTVPPGLTLALDTGGGDITADGLSGTMEARSDGGNVRIRKSAMTKVVTDTGGGDLDASFTAAPAQTEASSGGGNVTVRLPHSTYAVDARTDGGDRKVDVRSVPASPRAVKVRTGGGNATVVMTG